jgi:hypothetical protein
MKYAKTAVLGAEDPRGLRTLKWSPRFVRIACRGSGSCSPDTGRQLEDDGVFGFPILFHAARLTYQVEEYRGSPRAVRLKGLQDLRGETINRREVLSEDQKEMTRAGHAGQPSVERAEEGLRRVDRHIADLNAILEFIDEGIQKLGRDRP